MFTLLRQYIKKDSKFILLSLPFTFLRNQFSDILAG